MAHEHDEEERFGTVDIDPQTPSGLAKKVLEQDERGQKRYLCAAFIIFGVAVVLACLGIENGEVVFSGKFGKFKGGIVAFMCFIALACLWLGRSRYRVKK